jgi:hypothetical protein
MNQKSIVLKIDSEIDGKYTYCRGQRLGASCLNNPIGLATI